MHPPTIFATARRVKIKIDLIAFICTPTGKYARVKRGKVVLLQVRRVSKQFLILLNTVRVIEEKIATFSLVIIVLLELLRNGKVTVSMREFLIIHLHP